MIRTLGFWAARSIFRAVRLSGALLLLAACDSEPEQPAETAAPATAPAAVLAEAVYGGATERHFANDAVALPDGGFALVGQSGRRGWLLRLDGDGGFQWEHKFGGTGVSASLFEVASLPGGGVLVVGSQWSAEADGNVWLAELDAGGAVLWRHDFAPAGFFTEALGVARIGTEYLVAAVESRFGDAGTAHEFWLRRLGADRETLWEVRQPVRGPAQMDPRVFAVRPDGAGLLAGPILERAGIVTGAALWAYGPEGRFTEFTGIMQRPLTITHGRAAPDGTWVVVGQNGAAQGWIGLADESGRLQERTVEGGAGLAFSRVALTDEGALVLAGTVEDPAGASGVAFALWPALGVRHEQARAPTAQDIGALAVNGDGKVLLALNPSTDVRAGDITVQVLAVSTN